MKMKKLSILLLIGTLFVGCQQSKGIDEYKGLKTQETFEKVSDKMDKEVHYVHVVAENSETKYDQELYMIDGKIQMCIRDSIGAVNMSERYITDRFLPDKAIDLIDEACASVRMEIDSLSLIHI